MKSRRRWKRWTDRAFACALLLCACDRPRAPGVATGIELTPSLELRGSGDTVDIIGGSRPYIAASGHVVVAPVAATRGHFAAFDSSGRLYKVFGRTGRGPGEIGAFQGLPMLSGFGFRPGDTLLVGDRDQLRIHVFLPPPALTLAREIKVARRAMYFEVTPHGLFEHPVLMNPAFLTPGRSVRVVKPGGMIGTPPRLDHFDGSELSEFGEYRRCSRV